MISMIQSSGKADYPMPLSITTARHQHHHVTFYSTSGHPDFQIFCCTNGSGEVFIDHQPYVIKPNSGFILFPQTSYSLNPLEPEWIMDSLEFNGSICSELMHFLGMTESDIVYFSDYSFLTEITMKLIYMMQQESLPDDHELSTLCYDFLIQCPNYIHHSTRTISLDGSTHENELILKITSYLESNFAQSFSLDDLAANVNLNKKYMCTLYKKHTNLTIITELTYIRIGHARIFLTQNPSKSVKEIAKLCGFESAGYFGKVFKKITGVTPDQYRRKTV